MEKKIKIVALYGNINTLGEKSAGRLQTISEAAVTVLPLQSEALYRILSHILRGPSFHPRSATISLPDASHHLPIHFPHLVTVRLPGNQSLRCVKLSSSGSRPNQFYPANL